ncbi:MAG: class II fumarate hydratase [Syntrophorhabdales bacterium]
MTACGEVTRTETDSMGQVEVPADRYWGAQTQRALIHFSMRQEPILFEVVKAVAIVKKAAAVVNHDLGRLAGDKAALISRAAEEIMEGKLNGSFPLHAWTAGSGTHVNMNVNEVIANRAIELAGGIKGSREPIHPIDDVNMSQSTNDVFPTAMNIAAAHGIHEQLIPKVTKLRHALNEKVERWTDIVKIGRTHMQDAVPLTLGQEFSGYVGMLDDNLERINRVLPELYRIAIGGTAVGTGLTAPVSFGERAARQIADITGLPFVVAPNKFAVQGSHDSIVMTSSTLKTLAISLYKIANDIRLLTSGPRTGLYELIIPCNEPGSSMMPGKVNPTQCEAMAMVAVQVMGYDAAVALAGGGGYLEMNVYKPLMILNVIQSIRMLSDACNNFTDFLVLGMEPNRTQIDLFLHRSLMLVTALTPMIGYDRAAHIVRLADGEGLTLKEAATRLGYLSDEEFDVLVDPYKMAYPSMM